MHENFKQIKEKLQEELEKDSLDYGRVLLLANQIALQDDENLRFSVDAGAVNRFGRELVAKKETAVAELIKNGYDADATIVQVSFSEDGKGEIVIKDNGNGMTEEQLKHGYMRIATDEKVNEPFSPVFTRTRAGRKGIGRFAAQRLGHYLTISTQTEQSEVSLNLDINWDDFESGKDLFEIENHISKTPEQNGKGTTLTIKNLRDTWNLEEIKTIYSEIIDLIQPFPLSQDPIASFNRKIVEESSKPNDLEGNHKPDETDFHVEILSHKDSLNDVEINLETQVYDYALAEIHARVDENGYGYVSYKSDRLDAEEFNIPLTDEGKIVKFKTLRSVVLKAYYFIYKKKLINRTREKEISKLAENRSGIRIYRNGFRVSPYGEKGDDWIGLDASSRGRKKLPPHSNINFFGFVELEDIEGAAFEETASREKLIETDELKELGIFAYEALIIPVLRIAAIRGKKETAYQKDWKLNEARQQLKDIIVTFGSSLNEAKSYMQTEGAVKHEIYENLLKTASETETQLREFEKKYGAIQSKALEEQAMLRILASLGLLIGEFTHEITQTVGATSLGSKQLIALLEEGTEEYEIALELIDNIERFKAYATYFHETVAANADRELISQNLASVVEEFINTVRPIAISSQIEITLAVKSLEENLITCPMHPSEWRSILFNLYSNAHKAIVRTGEKGKILIELRSDDDDIYLTFFDNGDGIPEEHKDLVFEPFFTTTRKMTSAFQDSNIKGAGLGLKIVRDMITSYGGSIALDLAIDGYNTAFILEIPRDKNSD